MDSRYRITIDKRGFIPGVGNGPIRRPITVSKSVYDHLTKLGYKVTIVEDPKIKAKEIADKAVTETVPVIPEVAVPVVEVPEVKIEDSQDLEKVQDIIDNDDIVDTDTTEEVEPAEETVTVLIDDKDLSAEAFYNEAFLTSKNICKKILDARKVQYDEAASFATLKSLVAESNPVIAE